MEHKSSFILSQHAYLVIVRHIYAVFFISASIVTHPGNPFSISYVYGVHHNAKDGHDGSDYVHEHGEAHLRGNTLLFF